MIDKDGEYINKVLSGDVHAFRYFLENYKDMAFNIAVSIIKDDHYAEEIVQDAYMKAFNGLKSFNRTSQFKSWFYRIIVNESFQRLRKIKKDNSILEGKKDQEPYIEPDIEPENSKMEQVSRIMRSLPVKESLVLNLFYLEENTLKEISEITGWTIANIKVLLHRARKSVRTQLGSKYE